MPAEDEEVDDDVELSPPPQMPSNVAPHYSNVQEMGVKLQTSSEKKAGKGRGRGKAKAKDAKDDKVSSYPLFYTHHVFAHITMVLSSIQLPNTHGNIVDIKNANNDVPNCVYLGECSALSCWICSMFSFSFFRVFFSWSFLDGKVS